MRSAAILLMLAAAMVGSALARSDATEAGAEAYERSCAECHRSPERLVRRLSGDDGEQRQYLDAFLADHHAQEETMRRAIIDYLLGL
jgi:hypothetical protein